MPLSTENFRSFYAQNGYLFAPGVLCNANLEPICYVIAHTTHCLLAQQAERETSLCSNRSST